MQNLYKEDLVEFINEIQHPVWVYDSKSYQILTVNKSAVNLLGYSSDELRNMNISDLMTPDEQEYFKKHKNWKKYKSDVNSYQKLISKYGKEIFVELRSKEILYKKHPAHLVTVYDLTDRICYEKRLKESEERFRISQEISLDAFTIMKSVRDEQGEVVDFVWQYANPAASVILQHSSEELLGKRLLEVLPGNKTNLFEVYKKVVNTGISNDTEIRYKDDNIDGWFRNMTVKLGDGVAISFHDITQRKRQQHEIENKNREMNELVERISDAFIAMDKNWNITYINRTAMKILNISEDVNGKNFWTRFPMYAGSPYQKYYYRAMETQEPQVFDAEGKLTPRWYRISVFPSPEGVSVYAVDTTLSRAYEENLMNTLREKETLLKEVHHRIKNNLQIIISILNLQSYYIKDNDALEIFKQSQNRIRSMALIHEKLYKTDSLSTINLKNYITDVVKYLFSTYSITDQQVHIELEMEDIELDSNTAISFGLVLNELISNSLKYAFPGNRRGTVSIEAKKLASEIRFHISDNGKGIPPEIDFRNTKSLGLQLVNTLIDQLNGEVELEKNGGAKYKIVIPIGK